MYVCISAYMYLYMDRKQTDDDNETDMTCYSATWHGMTWHDVAQHSMS